MNLKINITDENGYLLEQIVVYQDGSDIEGARQIVEMIENRFETEQD